MSPISRSALSLVSLSAWAAAACVSAEPAESPVDAKKAPAPRVLLTNSKETRFVIGPLRSDGYVDYAAAPNERWRKGVTPENNSAVLFWQAVGRGEIRAEYRDHYFKQLEMPRPPAKGDYFIPLDTFIVRLRAEFGGNASTRAKEFDGAWNSSNRVTAALGPSVNSRRSPIGSLRTRNRLFWWSKRRAVRGDTIP